MAITSFLYGQYPLALMNQSHSDLDAGGTSVKCCLCTSSYTPAQDTDTAYSDVSTYEVAATGNYSTGGVALASKAITYASRVTTFDCADISWANLTVAAFRYAVIYDDTSTGNKLIMCINFGADLSVTASTLQFTVNASGLFTFTVAAEA